MSPKHRRQNGYGLGLVIGILITVGLVLLIVYASSIK